MFARLRLLRSRTQPRRLDSCYKILVSAKRAGPLPPCAPLIARPVTNITRIIVQDVSNVLRVIEQRRFETPKSQ